MTLIGAEPEVSSCVVAVAWVEDGMGKVPSCGWEAAGGTVEAGWSCEYAAAAASTNKKTIATGALLPTSDFRFPPLQEQIFISTSLRISGVSLKT
jgi:hypothetical protein